MSGATNAVAGVDFGTCWSSVVVRRPDGSTVRVKDPHSGASFSIPSAVAVDKRGELQWGSAAHHMRLYRPYESEFKRRLGDRSITVGEHTLPASDLVGRYLGWLRELAAETTGRSVERAVVTIPASYEGSRRGLMEAAARQAGFEHVDLLPEPVAAAHQAVAEHPGDGAETVLVYDLGGGTFDVAVVRNGEDGGVRVLAHGGSADVGGRSFDRLIIDDIRAHADAAALETLLASDDDPARARTVLELTTLAREVKHQLSAVDEHETPVPPDGFFYEVTRGRFEAMIAPLLDETLERCDDAVRAAELEWDQIDRVVMVGGSCRIPAVRGFLERRFGRPVVRLADPELAVADGAVVPPPAPKPTEPEPKPPEDRSESGKAGRKTPKTRPSAKREPRRPAQIAYRVSGGPQVWPSPLPWRAIDLLVLPTGGLAFIAESSMTNGARRIGMLADGTSGRMLWTNRIPTSRSGFTCLGPTERPDRFVVGTKRGDFYVFGADGTEPARGITGIVAKSTVAVAGTADGEAIVQKAGGIGRWARSTQRWWRPASTPVPMAVAPDLSWIVHQENAFSGCVLRSGKDGSVVRHLALPAGHTATAFAAEGAGDFVTTLHGAAGLAQVMTTWSVETGDVVSTLNMPYPAGTIRWVPGTEVIGYGTPVGEVLLYDLRGQLLFQFQTPERGLVQPRFSPDGHALQVLGPSGIYSFHLEIQV